MNKNDLPEEEVKINEEKPLEEVQTTEKIEENEVKEVSNKNMYPREEVSSLDDFYQKADNNQKNFTKDYNKIRKISNLVMIAFMVVIIVLLFAFGNNSAFIGIAIGLIVVYFVCLMVFSKKVKAKLNEESLRVLKEYFINLDSFVTSNENFTDVQFNYEEKLPEDTFKNLRICKDIVHVGGRDLIEGKLFSHNFIAGDNLIKTREKKEDGSEQDFIVFLGKLFVVDMPTLSEGRAIIYLKGKGANGPTDIDDLNLEENLLSDKFKVYSNVDISPVLEKIKDSLEKYEINDLLLDMFISFDDKKIGFGFSYVDSVMSVPLLDPLKKEDIAQYKKDVDIMIEIISSLVK